MKYLYSFLFLLFILPGCSTQEDFPATQQNLSVSAAASLTDAIEEIVTEFERENPSVHITINLGGSGKLAQQIQQGAPIDVFLSANERWMNVLAEQNLILPSTRFNFATNKLVLIGGMNTDLIINSLDALDPAQIDQIAIGNPESVPAGSYAKEALLKVGMWHHLKGKFVYAKDVRQVLTYVESGNTEIGFVYASDLLRSDKIKEILKIEDRLHRPIVYPAAVIDSSNTKEVAKRFLSFLENDRAQAILDSYRLN